MNIPIRFKTYKVTEEGTRTINIVKGLKCIVKNIKLLCTENILTGGSEWYETKGRTKVTVEDISLFADKEGNMKLMKTPEGVNSISLFIEQRLD